MMNNIPHPFFDSDVSLCDDIWAIDATSGDDMMTVECIVAGIQRVNENTYQVTFIPRLAAMTLIEEEVPIANFCYRNHVSLGEVLTFVPGDFTSFAVSRPPTSVKYREITGDFKAKSTHAILEARVDAYTDPVVAALAEYTTDGIKTRSSFYPVTTRSRPIGRLSV